MIKISPLPDTPAGVTPFSLIPDARERAYARNQRFKAAAGYIEEIGTALGIYEDSQLITPETVVPTLDGFAAQHDYHAAMVVGNRAGSTTWKIVGRRADSEKREELAGGTGKSIDLNITPINAGKPEQIELFVQLYKNNQAYGQPSPSIYITFNP